MITPNYSDKAIRMSIGTNGSGSFKFSYNGYTFNKVTKESKVAKIVSYIKQNGAKTKDDLISTGLVTKHRDNDLFAAMRAAKILGFNTCTKEWYIGENADLVTWD